MMEVILDKLSKIEEQVKLTNGRVTRLERILLVIFGIAIGGGFINLDHIKAFWGM